MIDDASFASREHASYFAERIADTLQTLASFQLPKVLDISILCDLEWLIVRITELRKGFGHYEAFNIAMAEYVFQMLTGGQLTGRWRLREDPEYLARDQSDEHGTALAIRAERDISLLKALYEDSMQKTLDDCEEGPKGRNTKISRHLRLC